MKKLVIKDKNSRKNTKKVNKNYFVLKSIIKNKHYFRLVRYKAYFKLKNLVKFCSIVSSTNRCVQTFSKKRFNKYTLFCRHIYLKLLQNGNIAGFQKSSW
jgi:ribosomal protein S14